jgi:hypothetical protein
MRSADPTDVPPNFMTSKLIAFPVSQKCARTKKPPAPAAEVAFKSWFWLNYLIRRALL